LSVYTMRNAEGGGEMTPDEKLNAVMRELYEGITGLQWPPDCTETRYTIKKLRKHAERIIEIVEGKDEPIRTRS
jgi:hypothetical protein